MKKEKTVGPSIWDNIWPLCDYDEALSQLKEHNDGVGLITQMFIDHGNDREYRIFFIYVLKHGSDQLREAVEILRNLD